VGGRRQRPHRLRLRRQRHRRVRGREPVGGHRQRLRRVLNGMLADGTVNTILRRHLGDAAARAAAYPEPAP